MAFTFKARLKGLDGKVIAGADVQACLFNTAGNPYPVATGKTTSTGYVTLKTTRNIPTFQPRVLLRRKQGRTWVRLSETPKTFRSGVADFGDLVVSTQPVANLATTKFYATNLRVIKPEAAGVKPAPVSAQTTQKLKTLEATNLTLSRQVAGHQSAIHKAVLAARAEEKKTADAKIKAKEKELASVQKNLKLMQTKQGGQTSIAELFESTGRQISTAQSKISSSGSRYKLGKIQMKLKVLPTAGMESVRVVGKDEKEEAAGASELTFDFSPDTSSGTQIQVKREVPDVTGYTRAMASRKLLESRFKYSVIEELIDENDGGASQHGRVVSQSPSAGEEANENSTVLLTIARVIG